MFLFYIIKKILNKAIACQLDLSSWWCTWVLNRSPPLSSFHELNPPWLINIFLLLFNTHHLEHPLNNGKIAKSIIKTLLNNPLLGFLGFRLMYRVLFLSKGEPLWTIVLKQWVLLYLPCYCFSFPPSIMRNGSLLGEKTKGKEDFLLP